MTYDNIQNITNGQGNDYTFGYLLDYNYFNNCYKMIAIDSNKQQALNADPKAVQKINFTGNLNQGENINDDTVIFFIIEEATGTISDFSQGTAKVL